MRIYLAATPDEAPRALQHCKSLAHVAYRIGPGSTLLRQPVPGFQGGLLSLSDCDAPVIAQPETLCTAVLQECVQKNYAGVLLDFESPLRQDLLLFAQQLGRTLSCSRRTLYLPEVYAGANKQAFVLIGTAISGGTLAQRLEDAVVQYGAGRLALDVQRVRMDFSLPCRTGTGTPLSTAGLRHLMDQEHPTCFFSPDLCARYFTYIRNRTPHLVLFDDEETLQRKIALGKKLGIPAAFLMWPEIRDLTKDQDEAE